MNNKQDWQGFESFQQDIKEITTNKSFVKIEHEHIPNKICKNKNQILTSHIEKKRLRKASQAITIEDKDNKKCRKEDKSFTLSRTKFNDLNRIERKISLKINDNNHEKIPIYKQPQYSPSPGTIIYRGFNPRSSQKYFLYFTNKQQQQITSLDSQVNRVQVQNQIEFNSKFESGNLNLAIKVKNNQYNLFMKTDTNTVGHRQWFYFAVKSKMPKSVKFNIFSFKKKYSLYQYGMRPYGKSAKDPIQCWGPIGSNIKYLKQDQQSEDSIRKSSSSKPQKPQSYYLTFTYTFLSQNQQIYFASCIPYTYTYLQKQILKYQLLINLKSNPYKQQLIYQQTILCKTLNNINVPLITIGKKNYQKIRSKYIIVNCRTHPGESSSSWVLDGFLNQVCSNQKFQQVVCENDLVIKIIPMLNPDGVIMGNYRTGILGVDYNRLFLSAKEDIYPQIISLKQLIRQCKKHGEVDLYLDLHGHSIFKNSFIFGPDTNQFLHHRFKTLPEILTSNSQYFSQQNCKMYCDYRKIETSRIFFQTKQDILSMTCENSLGLYIDQFGNTQQYTIKNWKEFGQDLVESFKIIYQKQHQISQIKSKQNYYQQINFLQCSSYRKDIQKQQQFIWKKSKTQQQSLQEQIYKLIQLQKQQISLKHSNTKQNPSLSSPPLKPNNQQQIQQQIQLLNDEDSQSQDLNQKQKNQLYNIVRTNLNKKANKSSVITEQKLNNSKQQIDFFSKYKKDNYHNKQVINNFKEYQFGNKQDILSNWQKQKRILSLPKSIRNQTLLNSFFIKKNKPIKIPTEITHQSIDFINRIKTQENINVSSKKQINEKTIFPKFINDDKNKNIFYKLLKKRY